MTPAELKVELEKLVKLSEYATQSYNFGTDEEYINDAEARDNQIGRILDIFGDM